jgi:mannitol/fructose-specific phosphotransferase system IIA component (Ntr-type)
MEKKGRFFLFTMKKVSWTNMNTVVVDVVVVIVVPKNLMG